jgi:glycosyltransferase involved in cell wall biosynthesis
MSRLWDRLRLPIPVEALTGPIDLYHATDFVLPPTLPRTKTLLTVHDLSFVRVPETATPRLKAYLDQVVPRSVKAADHILADSSATRDDLISIYTVPSDKITVLLSGVSPHFRPTPLTDTLRQKYRIDHRPYIFTVGTVQPRKNYARLAQAIAMLRAQGHDVVLCIAGGKGWLETEIHQAIQETDIAEAVRFLGFVDDYDLPALYSGAACMAFPSLYEGFGLPVLEAMACGTPVVTSNVSSLPEAAGNAALMVDPYDVYDLGRQLSRVLDDSALRANLQQRGLARVKTFTWKRAAQQLRACYASLLEDDVS